MTASSRRITTMSAHVFLGNLGIAGIFIFSPLGLLKFSRTYPLMLSKKLTFECFFIFGSNSSVLSVCSVVNFVFYEFIKLW